jgi:hypothetical protein
VDGLLRAVADDLAAGVLTSSLTFDRIHHPCDGSADILWPTAVDRDAMKHRHTDRLSLHPGGF